MTKKVKRQRVKKYSIIVIPDSRAKVWRWEFSRRKLEAALATCLTIVFVLTGSIWGFAYYRDAYIATEDIRIQNASFEQERFEMMTKLATLEQTVQRTERFANRLELSMNVSSDQMQKGIGPLAESDLIDPAAVREFDSLKFNTDENKLAFTDLSNTLEGVGEAIESVDERLHTVYELHQDRMTYWTSMPSISPTRGWITSDFGPRRRPIRGGTRFHKGIDVAATPGTPILAPGDGIVTFSGYKRGMGKTMMVDHGYGVVTVYGHNAANYVKEGDRVKRGEIIGSVGRTGLATGYHLHYQVEVDGVPVDPMRYVPKS